MHLEKTVRAGVFSDIRKADAAVAGLVAAGFPKDRITVICPRCSDERYQEYCQREPAGTKTGKAAALGGAIGSVLGGLGALTGVVLTGGTALLAVGPLLIGGGAGSFIGAMMSRGFEREVTNYYDQALQRGKILVAVQEPDGPEQVKRLAEAERILASSGPEPMIAVTEG